MEIASKQDMQRLLIVTAVVSLWVLVSCSSVPPAKTEEVVTTATFTPKPSATPKPNFTVTAQAGEMLAAISLATNQANATRTTQARATILALTPSRTPRPTQTSTPTIDPAQYFSWVMFQDADIGIAFEYPLYFDLKPYSNFPCGPRVSSDKQDVIVRVGERVWLSAKPFDQSRMSLSDYLNSKKKEFESDGETQIVRVNWGYVGGVRSVTVEYRFGALYRYGVETYFLKNNTLYQVVFSAGVTCDFAVLYEGLNALSEFDAYWHMLDTWQFLGSE